MNFVENQYLHMCFCCNQIAKWSQQLFLQNCFVFIKYTDDKTVWFFNDDTPFNYFPFKIFFFDSVTQRTIEYRNNNCWHTDTNMCTPRTTTWNFVGHKRILVKRISVHTHLHAGLLKHDNCCLLFTYRVAEATNY